MSPKRSAADDLHAFLVNSFWCGVQAPSSKSSVRVAQSQAFLVLWNTGIQLIVKDLPPLFLVGRALCAVCRNAVPKTQNNKTLDESFLSKSVSRTVGFPACKIRSLQPTNKSEAQKKQQPGRVSTQLGYHTFIKLYVWSDVVKASLLQNGLSKSQATRT